LIQVIGVHQIEPERKRRRRRTRKVAESDESTGTLTSDASLDCKPRRRRRANKKKSKNNTQQQQQNTEVVLSSDEQAQYVALDCEMVGVGPRGRKSSVAQVTLVGWNGEVIFDAYVKQDEEVTDYRTFVSGITEADLETAELTFSQCQAQVQELLEGKVLIGHALKNDLIALEITHPWSMTRDTGKYEPFMQVRFNDGVFWPRKLKDLVKERLERDIQIAGKPHSAFEDAMAALDLYRTVRRKWEKAMDYKIKKTEEIRMLKENKPQAE
jgi:DNA polymerase III epsilon subunit-like protein